MVDIKNLKAIDDSQLMRSIICSYAGEWDYRYSYAGRLIWSSVGLRQVEDDVWLVSFMNFDIAYFDMESSRVHDLENPFGPRVLGL